MLTLFILFAIGVQGTAAAAAPCNKMFAGVVRVAIYAAVLGSVLVSAARTAATHKAYHAPMEVYSAIGPEAVKGGCATAVDCCLC